jgi:tRNA (mo5U34)-methyltransferase
MELVEVKQFVDSHSWFHTIDLGNGIITPGAKSAAVLGPESRAIFDPLDLRGRSVLDVGAWNGFYTVESIRRGTNSVCAVDSPTWLRADLRGKETFDFVMERLGLNVRTHVIDVQEISKAEIGSYDVVLFLGVFYHLLNPIAALNGLSEIANEVLVVETYLDLRDCPRPAMVFYPGRELANDATNWWGPNRPCVESLLQTLGFKHICFAVNPAPGPGVSSMPTKVTKLWPDTVRRAKTKTEQQSVSFLKKPLQLDWIGDQALGQHVSLRLRGVRRVDMVNNDDAAVWTNRKTPIILRVQR